MARGVNRVILIGNVGQDPDIRYAPSGDAIANFSVATTDSWKDRQTGERHEKTEWHRCAAFKRTAEIVAEYVRKGSKLYIDGKLQTRKWQGQDGQDRYTTEIVVNELQMLDSRSHEDQRGGGGGAAGGQSRPQQSQTEPPADYDDDIPF